MSIDLPHKLMERLRKPLPGRPAQYSLAPLHRVQEELPQSVTQLYRESAVLVLLCRRQRGHWFIPLTLRAEYAGAHSAQVSLPGGKFDAADGNLERTALRECDEEIGLRTGIRVISPLTHLYIPVSRYMVQPFLAYSTSTDIEYRSHEREVKAMIELPVEHLIATDSVQEGEVMRHEGRSVLAPYILYDTHKIWGATAMILAEVRQLIREVAD